MKLSRMSLAWLAAGALAWALVSCGGGGDGGGSMAPHYTVTNLVSDSATSTYSSTHTDTHLINGWGVAFNPQGYVWVADNGTSKSTLYDGKGVPQSLVVSIPAGTAGEAEPTGIVFNGSQDFQVTQGGASGAAAFIFAGQAGTLAAWSPSVNPTSAITVYDGASAGKSYTGLALAAQGSATFLYAADFANGAIDVFDTGFAPGTAAGGFTDATLPAGYAPFGIQAIGNKIYIAYAKQDAQHDEVKGAGLGVLDVFDTNGTLIKRLVTGGALNAPWGIAMAPAGFGPFSNALLVANFGDGKINAFDATSGQYLGTLSTANGSAIVIDGLWGIAFGNGLHDQPTTTLFFAAGPGDEAHGLYGRIDVQ